MCYLEVGQGAVARVDVTFTSGQRPTGGLDGPSVDLAADKVEFRTSGVQRWFT
jgi:sulfide:quinone oxidoreductase